MVDAILNDNPETVMVKDRPTNLDKRNEDLEKEIEELENKGKEPVDEIQEELDSTPEPDSKEEQTWKKRYGDLRRWESKKEKDFKNEIKELKSQLKTLGNQKLEMPDVSSEEELEAWMNEYPDFAKILRRVARQEASKMTKEVDDAKGELSKLRREINQTSQERQLQKFHPDFNEIREDDKWYAWLDSKSKRINDAITDPDTEVEYIADIISMFKSETRWGKKKPGPKKEAPEDVTFKSGSGDEPSPEPEFLFSESQIKRMSDEDFEKNEEAIDDAMRKGLIKRDLSGLK